MSYRESDITHEAPNGRAWVLRDRKRKCYTVMIMGLTHSTSDSSYRLNDDGLSIAVAYANYRDRDKVKTS